jgi:hypothetical protein
MARFYFSDKTEGKELYEWIKSRPWCKNDKVAAFMVGQVIGMHSEMMKVWESGFWKQRKAGTFRTYWCRPSIVRTIKEPFFRNGEGFVDVITIYTPELAWRYNWKGDQLYVNINKI